MQLPPHPQWSASMSTRGEGGGGGVVVVAAVVVVVVVVVVGSAQQASNRWAGLIVSACEFAQRVDGGGGGTIRVSALAHEVGYHALPPKSENQRRPAQAPEPKTSAMLVRGNPPNKIQAHVRTWKMRPS